MDENLAKSCGATQATAKGMERILGEMKQIKSSIRDLNGAQTETNTLLRQQQLTLDAIKRSCEQQLEIKKLKLQILHAKNDTSKHIVEEFLFTMGGNEEDAHGDAHCAEQEGNPERPHGNGCDKGGEESDGESVEEEKEGAGN